MTIKNQKVKGVLLSKIDNVAVLAVSSGRVGGALCVVEKPLIKLRDMIPLGHKAAIKPIKKGQPIIKCGQVIGIASRDISPGNHVHVHNIAFTSKTGPVAKYSSAQSPNLTGLPHTFSGYLRPDGRAGTRNYVLVVATVNCSSAVVRAVARNFSGKLHRKDISRVVPIVHTGGCAQSSGGYPNQLLNRVLAGWIDHPNVVGAVVIGLGCELVRLETIFPALKDRPKIPILAFDIQKSGGTEKSIKKGIRLTQRLLDLIPRMSRQKLPVSLLTLAAKCGGSDSFSSITANPALGIASDLLVASGGTAVMGEIPECWGAKENLLRRCEHAADRIRLQKIFSWWKSYGVKHEVSMNDNISPGNIAGGISTILEKSIGASVKGGSAKVAQVLDFAERISKKGLVVMNTPGFDPVAMTGLVAGGCNLAAFTTGRGSVYGCSIIPTIKVSTNSVIYRLMRKDMDFDAGGIITGKPLDEIGRNLFELIISIAEGSETSSETQSLGDEEFVPWASGETL